MKIISTCPEFASEVTRFVHTTSQSITVDLTPWEKQNNAACESGHLQLPSLSMKNPEPYKTQLLHCKFPYANEQFI